MYKFGDVLLYYSKWGILLRSEITDAISIHRDKSNTEIAQQEVQL